MMLSHSALLAAASSIARRHSKRCLASASGLGTDVAASAASSADGIIPRLVSASRQSASKRAVSSKLAPLTLSFSPGSRPAFRNCSLESSIFRDTQFISSNSTSGTSLSKAVKVLIRSFYSKAIRPVCHASFFRFHNLPGRLPRALCSSETPLLRLLMSCQAQVPAAAVS